MPVDVEPDQIWEVHSRLARVVKVLTEQVEFTYLDMQRAPELLRTFTVDRGKMEQEPQLYRLIDHSGKKDNSGKKKVEMRHTGTYVVARGGKLMNQPNDRRLSTDEGSTPAPGIATGHIHDFFEEKARSGDGAYAVAYALLELAKAAERISKALEDRSN